MKAQNTIPTTTLTSLSGQFVSSFAGTVEEFIAYARKNGAEIFRIDTENKRFVIKTASGQTGLHYSES